MDDYGIGASARTGILVYEAAARGSGRTTRMVDALTDGAQVFTVGGHAADHLRRLIRDRRPELKKVAVHAVQPREAIRGEFAAQYGPNIWLDHFLVSQMYLAAADRLGDLLKDFGVSRARSQTTPQDDPPPLIHFRV